MTWDELRQIDPGKPFTVGNLGERLSRADPWKDLAATKQKLPREVLDTL